MSLRKMTLRLATALVLFGADAGPIRAAASLPAPLAVVAQAAPARPLACDGGLALELALSVIATAP